MIEGVRSWLLSVIAVCLLCALADALMPRGPVKKAGRLVCGLVLLCAMLAPLPGLQLETGQAWLEDYFAGLEQQKQNLKETADAGTKGIIEEQYSAYIVDKAKELDLVCQVRVTCRTEADGLTVPDGVEVAGRFSDEEQSRLTRIIEEELLVPPERQTYYSEEELP